MGTNAWDAVARYMEDVICEKRGVPGCDISVYQNHEPLYRHWCGVSDKDEKTPLQKGQLYYMFSCTKPVTITAGMRLWEEGRLDLDTPVGDILPAYRNVFLLKDGRAVPPEKVMTVRHLFTMTAGLNYVLHTPETDAVLTAAEGKAKTRQVVDSFAARPLSFSPGDRYQYSLCHDVLAAVIEEVTGMRFSEYLTKIIFSPLCMENTTFAQTEDVRARLASLYVSDKDGNVHKRDKHNDFCLSEAYESGGAGLISCVEDYARFADALASGGKSKDGYRLLKEDTVRYLSTEQLSAFTRDPAFSCAAGPGYGYGLGVRTRIAPAGAKSPLGEFGWDGAAGSYVMMDPVHRLSIFFAMHVQGWPACIGGGHGMLRDLVYTALSL